MVIENNKHLLAALVGYYRSGATVDEMYLLTGITQEVIKQFLKQYLHEKGEIADFRILT